MLGQCSSQMTAYHHLTGSRRAQSSTDEEGRQQLVMKESLDFLRYSAGSADCSKDTMQCSNSSLEVVQKLSACADTVIRKAITEDTNSFEGRFAHHLVKKGELRLAIAVHPEVTLPGQVPDFIRDMQHTTTPVHQRTLEAPLNPQNQTRKDRDTAADYIKTLDPDRPNVDMTKKIEKMKKKGIEKKIRRQLEEGSYNNFSVDERKLFGKKDTTLRLTWKGKYPKLNKLLKDEKIHKYINRRDYCGRTALHYAASWNEPQILKLLLSIPCINVDAQDGDQKASLRKAFELKSLFHTPFLMRSSGHY